MSSVSLHYYTHTYTYKYIHGNTHEVMHSHTHTAKRTRTDNRDAHKHTQTHTRPGGEHGGGGPRRDRGRHKIDLNLAVFLFISRWGFLAAILTLLITGGFILAGASRSMGANRPFSSPFKHVYFSLPLAFLRLALPPTTAHSFRTLAGNEKRLGLPHRNPHLSAPSHRPTAPTERQPSPQKHWPAPPPPPSRSREQQDPPCGSLLTSSKSRTPG